MRTFLLVFLVCCLVAPLAAQQSLIANYDFASDTTTLHDQSAQGLDGVVHGSPSLVADRFGNADGAWHFSPGDHVTIPSTEGLNPLPFSVSVWYKPDLDQNNHTNVPLFKKYTPALWNGFMMYTRVQEGSNFLSGWYIRNSSNRVISQYGSPEFNYLDAEVSEDMWRHAVFTVDSIEGRLYFDGQLQDTQPWDGEAMAATNSLQWQIAGTYNTTDTLGYQGAMDEMTIWGRALTEEEVFALYSEGGFDQNGCTDPDACNYDFEALVDNGHCIYPVIGEDCFEGEFLCTEGTWWHPGEQRCYPVACLSCPGDFDGDSMISVTDLLGFLAKFGEPCVFDGCSDPAACNFNPLVTLDDGSCVYGSVDACGCSYDCSGELINDNDGDGICDNTASIGCADPTACNYDELVCVTDSNTCIYGSEAPGAACDDGDATTFNDVWNATGCECMGTTIADEGGSGPCGGEQIVTFDNHAYPLVEIGEQCWFAENLRSVHYANGDAVPGDLSDSEWSETNAGAQAVYNNDNAMLETYGRLYNWHAVDDARGICPNGWHVPTDEEWLELEMFLGMPSSEANTIGWRGTDQGGQMKSSPEDDPSWNGSNSSGFSGLAGGARHHSNGSYFEMGDNGYHWSSTPDGANGWHRILGAYGDNINRNFSYHEFGFAVRCVLGEQ